MSGEYLIYKGRLVVPDIPDIRTSILFEAHSTPAAGHGGFLKTMKRVEQQYFWPKLKQDVRSYVQHVSAPNMTPFRQPGCFNRYRFHNRFGKIFH